MAKWSLTELRQAIRQVSGRLSISEMSNSEIDEELNQFVQYEFPAEVKLDRNYTYYTFNTTKNTQDYTQPETYTNFDPEAYIDNRELLFYLDADKFRSENPQNVSRKTLGTGDGSTTNFTDTLSPQPIEPGSVIVDDGVEVFTDDGNGTLTGDQTGSGTINYTTGALSVGFFTAPTNGTAIYVSWISYTVGQPTAVLMFNNKFTFFPVPDRAYRFRIKAWSIQTVQDTSGNLQSNFVLTTDRPLKDQWGPAFVYGTARRIHAKYGEIDAYQEVTALYQEQIGYVLRRTHEALLDARAMPKF